MIVKDLNEHRAMKQGTITPLGLSKNLTKQIEDGKVKHLICITVNQEDGVEVGWSGMNNLFMMGLLEAGKDEIKMLLEEDDL